MYEAARKFIIRVLLLHAIALVLVVGLTLIAGRNIYEKARQQVLDDYTVRQHILAQQTARGVEGLYSSIMSDLDTLRRTEENLSATTQPNGLRPPQLPPAQTPNGGLLPPRLADLRPLRGERVAQERERLSNLAASRMPLSLMHAQLQGRVSALFTYDRNQGRVMARSDDPANPQTDIYAFAMADWLKAVTKITISPYVKTADGGGHMMAIPSVQGHMMLVAVIPVSVVQERFIRHLDEQDTLSAALVDRDGHILGGLHPTTNESAMQQSLSKTALAGILQSAVDRQVGGTVVMEESLLMGPHTLPPMVAVSEPIRNLPDANWAVLVSTPLARVEEVVNRIFGAALFWSLFAVVSMTVILVSTSVLMIRGRMKMERGRYEAVQRELDQARQIQLAWLPRPEHSPPALDVAAINVPASQISGDFYDWFTLPDGRHVITIGDVTGHGLPAAFLMATTQLLVRNAMLKLESTDACLREVNQTLCIQKFAGQFVTLCIILVDSQENEMEIASAGHPYPLAIRPEGVEALAVEPGLMLGVDEYETYQAQHFVFHADATLLLYTDGIVEMFNPHGEQYGIKRLEALLEGNAKLTDAQSVIGHINHALHSFAAGFAPVDDLTMVAVRVKG
jgi:serine phosphatase RsbU (regulator of sigma subunit)